MSLTLILRGLKTKGLRLRESDCAGEKEFQPGSYASQQKQQSAATRVAAALLHISRGIYVSQ